VEGTRGTRGCESVQRAGSLRRAWQNHSQKGNSPIRSGFAIVRFLDQAHSYFPESPRPYNHSVGWSSLAAPQNAALTKKPFQSDARERQTMVHVLYTA
jgi:hypothetical protein